MELAWFVAAFDQAAVRCREFAEHLVTEELPPSLRFDFLAAGRPTDQAGRVKYLGGRLLLPVQLRGVEPIQARKYLWVNGKVPFWINLAVQGADAEHTYIEIVASNQVTDDLAKLYHQQEGNPPFHVLGPHLPPWWVSLAKTGKFSLGWRSAQ